MRTLRNIAFDVGDLLRRTIVARFGGMTVGVRALVLSDANEVLLIRHTYLEGWHTPGGGTAAGETPLACLKRELSEEVGLELAGHPQLLHIYTQTFRNVTDYPIFFLVRDFSGTAEPRDKREIAEVRWVPFEEAKALATPRTAQFLKEFEQDGRFRDFW